MDDTKPLLRREVSQPSSASIQGCTVLDHAEVGLTYSSKKSTLTGRLAFAVTACILGSSFQVGFNTAVINSPEDVIERFFNETNIKRGVGVMSEGVIEMFWAITVSCYAAGGMVGGLSAGFWANRHGRKRTLLWNNTLAVIAGGLMGFSRMAGSPEMLITGRFISGINAGINSGVAPLYLSEISSVRLRGLLGTFNQIAICTGVLIAEVIGIKMLLGTDGRWPFTVAFTIVPVLFQMLTLPYCPETPRFLMVLRNEEDEAEKALVWLRHTEDVGEELEDMRSEGVELRNSIKFSVSDLFWNPELRWPLIICVVLQLAQQFSGINAVTYYSTSVFHGAGLSDQASQYATIGTGLVNVCWTFVSAILMDRLGRRTLMIVGLGGMLIFTVVLTVSLVYQHVSFGMSYLCIAAVVSYIIAFATGPGAIPWFYVAELFAQGPRSAAVSVSVLVNWFANFTVGLVYPELQASIGNYSFVPFAVMLLIFLLFVIIYVPETKGKKIEDITLLFKQDGDSRNPSESDLSYHRQINESSGTVQIL